MLRRSGRSLLLGLVLASAAGCSALRAKPTDSGGPLPSLAGVWEGLFRSTLDEGMGAGDTRIERQAWRLTQRGDALAGFYVVEVTMISGDGRPYLCSREPRFSTVLRLDVRGRVAQNGIEIEEIGDVRAKGACRPTFRSPARYRAVLRGDVLTLVDGDRRLPLYRRPAAETAAAETSLLTFGSQDGSWAEEPSFPSLLGGASLAGPGPASPAASAARVDGLWVWEHRGRLPGGDEKVEREEWHLVQEGDKVSGYYDRAVRQISTDGHAYRCNQGLDFRVVTRYRVSGEVRGNLLVIYERGFEILEGSPCDDGRRRLDAYQGEVGAAGELRLMWGVGTQVLRRARPNVPTQRF